MYLSDIKVFKGSIETSIVTLNYKLKAQSDKIMTFKFY